MRRKALIQVLTLALLLPALAAADPVVYKVDPDHSGVGFTIRHFVSNVSGRFKDFDGVVKYDKANPAASSVSFTVQAKSIDTDNDDRDNHLRSPDFFDVEKFPTLTFTSTSVKAADADTLEVTGDLTIKGVTKKVTIPVDVLGSVKTPRGEKAGFETSFKLDRKEYGITWNRALDTGGAILGDDVKVVISVESDRQEAAPAKPAQ
ncbi:MAG TPA: YceI family protein [Thermoanaerobaculia bacterium]|nr:YceI family protein [Thermoanaerobaculia bacterium]